MICCDGKFVLLYSDDEVVFLLAAEADVQLQ